MGNDTRRTQDFVRVTLLIFAWSFIQTIAYFHFEMRQSVDTALYLERADDLLTGDYFAGRDLQYISYIALIAAVKLFGMEPACVIILQLLSGVGAILCTYAFTKQLAGRGAATLACALYICWFKFQQWNLILYTDALFANLAIVALYLVARARTVWSVIVAITVVVFTSLLRPPGIGLIVAVVVYWSCPLYAKYRASRLKVFGFALVGIVLFLLFLNAVLSNFVESFINSYLNAEIIYPNISLGVSAPATMYVPDQNRAPLIRLLMFAGGNPVYFFKIFALKGVLFLAHIKPYYSRGHNIFIVLYLYPAYVLAVIGGKRLKENRRIVLTIVTFVVMQILIVCFTSLNWDGRFLLPVLPPLSMLAAIGALRRGQNKD